MWEVIFLSLLNFFAELHIWLKSLECFVFIYFLEFLINCLRLTWQRCTVLSIKPVLICYREIRGSEFRVKTSFWVQSFEKRTETPEMCLRFWKVKIRFSLNNKHEGHQVLRSRKICHQIFNWSFIDRNSYWSKWVFTDLNSGPGYVCSICYHGHIHWFSSRTTSEVTQSPLSGTGLCVCVCVIDFCLYKCVLVSESFLRDLQEGKMRPAKCIKLDENYLRFHDMSDWLHKLAQTKEAL